MHGLCLLQRTCRSYALQEKRLLMTADGCLMRQPSLRLQGLHGQHAVLRSSPQHRAGV